MTMMTSSISLVDVYTTGSDQTPSVESSQNGRIYSDGGSSGSSSQDQFLSDKLKLLLEQSDNIQRLIAGTSSQCRHNSDTYNWDTPNESSYFSENRIPSENEQGVRSDMNDIILRCEELEQKVEMCSTKDIRERLMKQLHDIDKEGM